MLLFLLFFFLIRTDQTVINDVTGRRSSTAPDWFRLKLVSETTRPSRTSTNRRSSDEWADGDDVTLSDSSDDIK